MEELERLISLRDNIQQIDKQLVDMLCERIHFAKEIGEIKKKNGKPIYVPEVEKQKIETLAEYCGTPGLVETIWPVIMCYTRSVE
jgi:chorismate mutase